MSSDMSSSWRHISSAGSRLSSLKGYLVHRDSGSGSRSPRTPLAPNEERQSWRAWAGQKIRVRRRGGHGDGQENTELVNVFPGWAVRRYARNTASQGSCHFNFWPPSLILDFEYKGPNPFEVDVFVSGYAISYRPPEKASRSQRAFIRLAKGKA
jgi:hypothetical protein